MPIDIHVLMVQTFPWGTIGDHGAGGGAHQGPEAVPVIPIISPGRPVRAQDQQGGDVPGDHQGAEGVGVLQGDDAVAAQQKLFRLPTETLQISNFAENNEVIAKL